MRALTLLFVCAWVVASGNAAPGKLNLFIWSEYIDPRLVASFEHAYDCKVTIDLYEDAESMLAKVQAGGLGMYDLVVPPDHLMPVMQKLKLLGPLRRENVPNLKNLDEKFLNPPYDPGNEFSVPYQWGTVGVFARQAADKPLPRTWGIFFDPKLQPGPFVLIDSARDLIGTVLKYKGWSLNSADPAVMKTVRDVILEAKKRSAGFDGSVGAKNKVLARGAQAAIVYSGEGLRGMKEDKDTVYFVPDEGSQIWVDNLAVVAKAPHRDLAEKFINFLLEAQNGAQLSAFTRFASPNKASFALLPPEEQRNPSLYPPQNILGKLEFLKDLGSKARLYDEVWTKVKAQ
jgi:spermidine/putrescine transport system substrate-binding protein